MNRLSIALVVLIALVFAGAFLQNLRRIDPTVHGDMHGVNSTQADVRTVVLASAPAKPTLVGKAVCKECHAKNHGLHSMHGHASTFFSVSETDLAKKLAGKKFDAGKAFGTYEYLGDQQGDLSVTLPAKYGDESFPLQFALGSGHRAQTMLTLVPGVDGVTEGIEHRVSCYAAGRTDLTPGHTKKEPRSALEYFGVAHRGLPLERCIYCHTTSAEIVGQKLVDLIPSINCEKCHGPGSEHVRLARESTAPPPYSVGRKTWDAESELQLCGDCHRMPRSVTEKEIREYPDFLVRFQPIGILRSECYLKSDGELRCTSCHNPHKTLKDTPVLEHTQNCVRCHLGNASDHVACPVSPKEKCVDCHMPKVEVEQGLEFFDHWIRVPKQ